METQLQVWTLKKKIRPVLLDTLASIHVTCNVFLMHWFSFDESYNDFSSKKSTFLQQKIIKIAEKSLISRYG